MERTGELPQSEYFKVKNDWWDALIRYRIPGTERQCLDFIIRRTFGWQKKESPLSLTEFSEATGIAEPNVHRILKRLKKKKVVIAEKIKGNRQVLYSFNKYYQEWEGYETIITDSFDKSKTVMEDSLKLSGAIVSKSRNDSFDKAAPITSKDTSLKTNKDKPPIVPQKKKTYSEDFLNFYKAYPVKKSKDKAWQAWKKRNGDMPPLQDVLKAIAEQKAEKKHLIDHKGFAPEWKYPATWINGGCWDDEVTKPEPEVWDNYCH